MEMYTWIGDIYVPGTTSGCPCGPPPSWILRRPPPNPPHALCSWGACAADQPSRWQDKKDKQTQLKAKNTVARIIRFLILVKIISKLLDMCNEIKSY